MGFCGISLYGVLSGETSVLSGETKMGKKKVEHVVFDGMCKIKKQINISEYNKKSFTDKRKQPGLKSNIKSEKP